MLKTIFFTSVLIMVLGGTGFCVNTLDVDSATYNFTTPTKDDFNTGFMLATQATTVTVTADSDWTLQVKTTSINMGGYGKSLNDFLLRKNGTSNYLTLSTTPQNLDTGTTGTNYVYVDYKLLLNWALDAPNTYSIVVTYTLTTQ